MVENALISQKLCCCNCVVVIVQLCYSFYSVVRFEWNANYIFKLNIVKKYDKT